MGNELVTANESFLRSRVVGTDPMKHLRVEIMSVLLTSNIDLHRQPIRIHVLLQDNCLGGNLSPLECEGTTMGPSMHIALNSCETDLHYVLSRLHRQT